MPPCGYCGTAKALSCKRCGCVAYCSQRNCSVRHALEHPEGCRSLAAAHPGRAINLVLWPLPGGPQGDEQLDRVAQANQLALDAILSVVSIDSPYTRLRYQHPSAVCTPPPGLVDACVAAAFPHARFVHGQPMVRTRDGIDEMLFMGGALGAVWYHTEPSGLFFPGDPVWVGAAAVKRKADRIRRRHGVPQTEAEFDAMHLARNTRSLELPPGVSIGAPPQSLGALA